MDRDIINDTVYTARRCRRERERIGGEIMTYIGILFMKCVICLPSFAPNKFIHHILNPFGHQGFDFKFNNYVNFGQ